MIDVKELRIGNLVAVENNGTKEITSINSLSIGTKCDDAICHFNNKLVSPIPLTPEILEQCGFDVGRIPTYFQKIASDIKISTRTEHYRFNISQGGHDCIELEREIKYLHQLQNLYHSLTGEELQVNIHDNAKEEKNIR